MIAQSRPVATDTAAKDIELMKQSATLSPCRTFRYELWRRWTDSDSGSECRYAMFVGLNPSTADETRDDPTIRRCISFAQDWGYDALCMTNLFAFRATKPKDMRQHSDPIGPDNDDHLIRCAKSAGVIVAAWGVSGTYNGRDMQVRALLPNLHFLRLTARGHPSHPLYLPKSLTPVTWTS